MADPLLFPFVAGMIAILVASYITRWVLKRDSGTARMREVSRYIMIGTGAYIKRQLGTIILVIPWLALIILFLFNWTTSLAFVCGVLLSLLAVYVGMDVAVRNQRENRKCRYAFTGGNSENRLFGRCSYGSDSPRDKFGCVVPFASSLERYFGPCWIWIWSKPSGIVCARAFAIAPGTIFVTNVRHTDRKHVKDNRPLWAENLQKRILHKKACQ